jgi:hypothetical protein
LSRGFRPSARPAAPVSNRAHAGDLTGVVLGVDGKPLAGATVCTMAERMIGIVRDRLFLPDEIEHTVTDANGVFHVPLTWIRSDILVLHDQGCTAHSSSSNPHCVD